MEQNKESGMSARKLWLSMAKLAAENALEVHKEQMRMEYEDWRRKPASYKKNNPWQPDRASLMFTFEDYLSSMMDSWQRMDKEGKAA
jgi:hypothetical protein